MKLLVISHPCVVAANQSFFKWIAELSGWEVTLVVPARWRSDFTASREVPRLAGFAGRIIAVPVYFSGNITLHMYHWRLLAVLRAERADVVYVHNESHALSTFQAVMCNRFAGRARLGFYAAQNLRRRYPWPARLIERCNLRAADFGFPVTEAARAILLEKGFAGRLAVLPLGLTEAANSVPAPAAGCPVIGYVGRLVAAKGVDVLLRALAGLRAADWRCDIIGDGPARPALAALAAELGLTARVRFLGYVAHGEVFRNFRGLAMLVVPSRTMPNWREQFGRVIIEALAAGVPVIGSDSGEIPVLIGKLGGGLVVPENAPPALAAAIDRLLADPALRVALAARGLGNVRRYFLERDIAAAFVAEVGAVLAAA
jgi:glycosyltransferase involved in cell wall biosynthesis